VQEQSGGGGRAEGPFGQVQMGAGRGQTPPNNTHPPPPSKKCCEPSGNVEEGYLMKPRVPKEGKVVPGCESTYFWNINLKKAGRPMTVAQ